LRVRGETVVDAEPVQSGYCGRGISALAEGEPLDDVLPLIERSCSAAGGAHRLALCMAAEDACGVQPPRFARLVRALFVEIERVQARLWMLALLARAFGLSEQFGIALEQRESLFEGLKRATGSRMYPGIVVPGGVRTDLDLEPLQESLDHLGQGIAAWRTAASRSGLLGRLGAGVGIITAEQVAELHLAGLSASGQSASADLRRTSPYGGYADLAVEWPALTEDAGDVAARVRAAVEDVATSLTIAQACFAALAGMSPDEPIEISALEDDSTLAEATVEGTHGPVTVSCVLSSDMHIGKLEMLTPVLDLFDGLEELVAGRPLAQLPAFLASLDLCMECVDQ
jgi:Ni,Fe-hydrogenase III large subunit